MEAEPTEGTGLSAAHDLVIRSAIPLPGLRGLDDFRVGNGAVDVEVELAGEPSHRGIDDAVVARDATEGRQLTVVRSSDGDLRVHGEGLDMSIDETGSVLQASCDPQRSGSLGWWIGGLGLGVALMQRGHLVLHGSLVSHGGRGVLLMAPSGHGKSVTAAAACAAGALLVAEDTVRIDGEAAEFSAPAGSQVLRTRRTAAEMTSMFPSCEVYESSDGRVLVEPESAPSRSTLDRLVFLKLDRGATEASVDEVDPMTALRAGFTHLRLPGLVDTELMASSFERLAALVDAVPARVFHLPWTGSLDGFDDHVAYCLEAC